MGEHQTTAAARHAFADARLSACEAGPSALASLAGHRLSERYCGWRGASEQRYVASIYPVDPVACGAGLPAFDGFVLIAVARAEYGRRVLFVRALERSADLRSAVARGLAEGADEWHAHLLAETSFARAAVAADLARRHAIGRVVSDDASRPPVRLAS